MSEKLFECIENVLIKVAKKSGVDRYLRLDADTVAFSGPKEAAMLVLQLFYVRSGDEKTTLRFA